MKKVSAVKYIFVLVILYALVTVIPQSVSANPASKSCQFQKANIFIVNTLKWDQISEISTPKIYKLLNNFSTASLAPGRTDESKDSSRFYTTLASGARTIDDTFDDYTSLYKLNKNSEYNADTSNMATSFKKANKTMSLFGSSSLSENEIVLISDSHQNILGKQYNLKDINKKTESDINIVSIPNDDILDDNLVTAYNSLDSKSSLNIIIGSVDYEVRHLSVIAIDFGKKSTELFSRTRLRKGLVEVQDIAPTIFKNLCITPSTTPQGGAITTLPTDNSFNTRIKNYENDNDLGLFRKGTYNIFARYIIGLIFAILILIFFRFRNLRYKDIFDRILSILGSILVGIFCSTYLSRLFPITTYGGLNFIALSIATLLTIFFLIFKHPVVKPLFVSGLLTLDLFCNNYFQIHSPFGYSYVGNSRSYGFSNYSGAAFGVSILFLCFYFTRDKNKYISILIALVGTIIIALPSLGADVGGTLALVTSLVLLQLFLNRSKLNFKKLVLPGMIAIFISIFFGFLDYLRPVESRTHLGRTFSLLINFDFGELTRIFIRKFEAAAASLGTWWFPILILAMVSLFLMVKDEKAVFTKKELYVVLCYSLVGTFLNDAGTIFGGVGATLFLAYILVSIQREAEKVE